MPNVIGPLLTKYLKLSTKPTVTKSNTIYEHPDGLQIGSRNLITTGPGGSLDPAGAGAVRKLMGAPKRSALGLLGDSTSNQHINNMAPFVNLGNQGWWVQGNELAGAPIRRFVQHGGSGQTTTEILTRVGFVAKDDVTVQVAIASITTSGTTATITTEQPHGIPNALNFSIPCAITGSAVAAYNLAEVNVLVTGDSTLTMQIASGTANDASSAATLTYTNFGVDVCAVAGSINDVTALSTSADAAAVSAALDVSLGNLEAMYLALIGKAILPIANTVQSCTYVSGSTNLAGAQIVFHLALNEGIRKLAAKYGLPLCDLFLATVDGASSVLAGKTGVHVADGKHLANLGGFLGGLRASKIVKALWPAAGVDLPGHYLESSSATSGNKGLMKNPLFTGTSGAVLGTNVSGTVATDWRVRLQSGTVTSAVCSLLPYLTNDEFFWSIKGSTPGVWTTGLVYSRNECVLQSSVAYRCVAPHASGTFATDLASGYWEVADTSGFIQQVVVSGASAGAIVQVYYASAATLGTPTLGNYLYAEGECEVFSPPTAPCVTVAIDAPITYGSQVQGFTNWSTSAGKSSTAAQDVVIGQQYKKVMRTRPLKIDPAGASVGPTYVEWLLTFGASGGGVFRFSRSQAWDSQTF